jgi:hypothetical protein
MRALGARHAALIIAVTAVPLLGAAPASARRVPAHARIRPYAFASCAALVGYARAHFTVTRGLPEMPVRALSEPTNVAGGTGAAGIRAAAPQGAAESSQGAGSTYSTTNNQEPGVDEPDTVKTDGRTIFAVEQGTLRAVDVSGAAAPRVVGSLSLGSSSYGVQLLLRGTRLLVISPAISTPPLLVGAQPALPASARAARAARAARDVAEVHGFTRSTAVPIVPPRVPTPYFYGGTTTLSEVDVSDPAAMKIVRTFTVDGSFVDARQNGGTARLVIASAPPVLADRALRARASGWIPARRFHSFITGRRSRRPVASCTSIRRPIEFSGLGMLSILTINLDRGLYAVDATAVMADAQVVYGSQHNLFIATQRWIDPNTPLAALPAHQETTIDEFDVSNPDTTTLVASGDAPGFLLNQFSLSEDGGYLRVASTSEPIWWAGRAPAASQSYVTVLANRAGSLVPVGQIRGLGTGQTIYSVRFIGKVAYVVTFRSVDPLYTVDLSVPSAPRVAGTLELAGYSAYLHPVGAGLLLGIGQAVGAANEPSGTQLELFDTSDPAAPRLLARTLLGEGSSSTVQYEHHAFLFWPASELVVIPVSIFAPHAVPLPLATKSSPASGPEAEDGFTGAIGFHVDRAGISELGRVEHDPLEGFTPSIDRALVLGGRLFTVSREGLMVSDLATLARLGFAVFS